MSSHPYEPSIDIQPRPSRRLGEFYALLYTAAGLVVVMLTPELGPWAVTGLIVMLAASASVTFRFHVRLRDVRAVRRLVRDTAGNWQLMLGTGESLRAELLPDSIVHRRLLVLNFRARRTRRRHSVVLLPDSLGPEIFRQLVVGLRTAARGPQTMSSIASS